MSPSSCASVNFSGSICLHHGEVLPVRRQVEKVTQVLSRRLWLWFTRYKCVAVCCVLRHHRALTAPVRTIPAPASTRLGGSLESGPPPRIVETGWKDVGKVLLLATILDVIYQLIVHGRLYILELLITAVALTVILYVLFCGPSSRTARAVFAARPSVKQRLTR
jgi:hypothetical protein